MIDSTVTTFTQLPPAIKQPFNRYLLLGPWLGIEECRLKFCGKALKRYRKGSKKYLRIMDLERKIEHIYERTKTKKTQLKETAKERSRFPNATLLESR